ncbi:lipocalin family protein [Flavobacterium sp. DG1-102-2]|uniref:lipocalin family protein n=1 Tax=Flavobacterium sp. DG1-102-2 TaxID=3081663 RepID=UPI0029496A41|nr:lipocalin family protein [Flavobacterium sp. DG1-102-2]MDV6170100.1 lipocalin family protein [Flavobacterium sp. DG1-102-2]
MRTITRFLRSNAMICLLLGASLFVSCQDDDSDKGGSGNSIVGVWQKTKEETRLGSGTWQAVTEDCDLDDTEEYKSDGSWTFYPGTVTCGSAAVLNGTWKLRANDTKVLFTYDGVDGAYESTLEELTDSKLVLTHSAGDVEDTQYRDTYKRK